MIENRIISEPELAAVEKEDYETVEEIRKTAWEAYLHPILEERVQVMDMLDEIAGSSIPCLRVERHQRTAGRHPCAIEA